MRKLGIYVHIPFCVRKCLYCDFLSFPAGTVPAGKCPSEGSPAGGFLNGKGQKAEYMGALLREIRGEAPKYRDYTVDSVFLGGGTPTVLSGEQIGSIMECLRAEFAFTEQPEITMEANPGTVDRKKLEACRRAGVNRLSIGAQSLQDGELAALGRVHTVKDFFQAYRWAQEAGFSNINVDLMAALPGQRTETYLEGLRRVMELEPAHISAYSLIIEEGTPFWQWYGEGGKPKEGMAALPEEEEERLMYTRTAEVLAEGGYFRYEISNYARHGYECRHNMAYWKRQDYVGFGLGASSMVENVRWKNTADMGVYLCGAAAEEIQPLRIPEQMEEFMFLGLRLTEGVSQAEFYRTFGKEMAEVYGDVVEKLCAQGLLSVCGEQVSLTSYGRDVSNYVMAEFLF